MAGIINETYWVHKLSSRVGTQVVPCSNIKKKFISYVIMARAWIERGIYPGPHHLHIFIGYIVPLFL